MKASEFASQLRDEVTKIAASKNPDLSAKILADFLTRKIGELDAAEKNTAKVHVDLQTEHYKAKNAFQLGMFQSVLDYGKHALNAAMIVNAGASVALLSFIGNLATKLEPNRVPSTLVVALTLYVCGVGSAALATGGAYCTQFYYAEDNDKDRSTGKKIHILTIALTASSYLLFFAGAFVSYLALRGFACG